MSTRRVAVLSAFLGGLVWLGVVAARLIGRSTLPSLTLILLLGVLVIAPLALLLVALPHRTGAQARLYRLAVALQPPAALLAAGALIMDAGPTAMLLSIPWLAFTLVVAAHGAVRQLRIWPPLEESALNFGLIYLGVGGVWFLASRGGLSFLGFQEPIVTLTAIHFHFISLGALIFTGMVGRSLHQESSSWGFYRLAAAGMIVSPFLVALGITFSVVIEAVATALATLSLLTLAAITLVRIVPQSAARKSVLLITASLSILFTMSFATAYAFGRLTGAWELSIPTMIEVHGWVNALGFVLPGLLAWASETPPGRIPASPDLP
ncbi:MAG: YndJ family protein [Chloroflexota bacterium]